MIQDFIAPDYLKPHYSTKLCKVIYHYCVRFYSKETFHSICDELKVPADYLLADDNWVSEKFSSDFLNKLKEKTGDEEIFRKIGTFFLDRENINSFEYMMLSSMTPYMFFRGVPFNYGKINQINSLAIVKAIPGKFIYVVKPKIHDVKAHPDVCQNTIGVFESAKELFELNRIEVQHTECIHQGARECKFELHYSARSFWNKRSLKVLGWGAVVTLFTAGVNSLTGSNAQAVGKLLAICTGLFGIIAAFFIRKYFGLIKYNKSYYEKTREKNEAIYESKVKLDRRYRESHLIRALTLKLLALKDPDEIIRFSIQELASKFGYGKVLLMQLSPDQKRLFTKDVVGFHDETERFFKLSFVYPGEKKNPQIFANIVAEGKSSLIANIDTFKKNLKEENRKLVDHLGVKSLIATPLQDAETKYGLIVVGTVTHERTLDMDDQYLIDEVAKILSLFFRNTRAFQRETVLRGVFQKYVPKVVLDSLTELGDKQDGTLQPTTKQITSIFTDLRGFTTSAENMHPEQVVDMLNHYSAYVSHHIAEFGGIVDNLIGDGVVGFFTSTANDEYGHHARGMLCAAHILAGVSELNSEFQKKGYPTVSIGIGINSGIATVGNIGSDRKMNYTAVGDTVNLASRLEGITKKYISGDAASGCAVINQTAIEGVQKLTSHQVIFRLFSSYLQNAGATAIRGRAGEVNIWLLTHENAVKVVDAFQEINSKKTAA